MVKDDIRVIGRLIDEIRPKLGDDIVEIRYRLGNTWDGDPGIFILVVMSDELAKDWPRYGERTQAIARMLLNHLVQADVEGFPYPTFRIQSEQADVDRTSKRSEGSWL